MKKSAILIISGFLGSGKTTFIKKLIKEADKKHKLMVIENDFGQVSFDADLLVRNGIKVRELTSGCICCSLAGDFQAALKDVLAHNNADLIIIEPSGVAKLSDIISVCIEPNIKDKCFLIGSITIVDATKTPLYFNNFGEFFKDQIKYTNCVLFTHAQEIPNQTNKAIEIIRTLASNIPIHEEDWDSLNFLDDLNINKSINAMISLGDLPNFDNLSKEHKHASPIFSSITFKSDNIYTRKQCEEKFKKIISNFNILRIKGYLKSSTNNFWEIQYTPSNLEIKESDFIQLNPTLTIIGTNLRGGKLERLWEEV